MREARRAGRALRAEWTKLCTVPSQLWTLAALTAVMAGVTALTAAGQGRPRDTPADPAALALSGVYFAQLAAVAVGVALVASEYQPRVIRTTLAAHPGRTGVLAAKAAVVAAAVLGAGVPGVLGSLLAGRAVSAGQGHAAAALSDPAVWRAAAGTLLYLALVALLGAGVAAVLRHGGVAVGATAALLYGPFLATKVVPMSTHALHVVQKVSPMSAGLAVQTTLPGTGTAPLAPWTGLGVLAAWAGAAVALGWAALRFRDA
ncbi:MULTISPECIES: hypothetical protein [Streptomyces]|uniref:ABC-2 type transport system permease protein n=1 Tax=Streptomyces lonegramiae TaxID=3075524 RepID=A0ABU2XPX8_9ACTN|nr:hypothetical protein [Streptomyces sp. DSM 41529]MDT0547984.1 hypothetical protein [Streptomyces sp. DSM 41529]